MQGTFIQHVLSISCLLRMPSSTTGTAVLYLYDCTIVQY
jgi:hypothetical protein